MIASALSSFSAAYTDFLGTFFTRASHHPFPTAAAPVCLFLSCRVIRTSASNQVTP